jgi:hypothetical protein
MSTAPHERIETRCPACGNATLFIGAGGHLVCSWLKCPDPGVGTVIDQLKANQVEGRVLMLGAVLRWDSGRPADGALPPVRQAAADL